MKLALTEGIKARGASRIVGSELFTENTRYTMNAVVEEAGSVYLTSHATSLLSVPCSITADDKHVIIRQGKTVFTCLLGAEFAIPSFDDEGVEYKKISPEAIASVSPATGDNALGNLFFAGDSVCATNGFRLQVVTLDTIEGVVPLKGMFASMKEIGAKDGFAFIKGDGFLQKLALSNSALDWKKVLPETQALLSVNKKEFAASIKSILPALTAKHIAVQLTLDKTGIGMVLVGEMVAETFFSVVTEMENAVFFLLNATYLMDAVASAPADAVTIGTGDHGQFIIECDGYKAVVMPLKGLDK